MDATTGKRFERFVRDRWREIGSGGIRGLCREVEITPEALYLWFKGTNEPKMGHLTDLARVLRVSRWEIVAAMDGYDLAAARREAIAEEVEAAVAPLRALMRDAGLLRADTAPGEEPLEAPTSAGRAA